jgi:hypothetical protein
LPPAVVLVLLDQRFAIDPCLPSLSLSQQGDFA